MTFRSLTAAAVAAFFMAAVSGAQAATALPNITHHSTSRATATRAVHVISSLRISVWTCQSKAEFPLSKAGQPARELAATTVAYRAWVVKLWRHRLGKCERLLQHTLPVTHDWQTAVHVTQRVYPGSSWWLLSCSASEGGSGPFVFHSPHREASLYEVVHEIVINTPGGWMQYFHSTFVTDFNAAVQDLHARGVRVPPSAFSWYSPLGQAIAGGWAYSHDRPPGKWTGAGC